MGPCWFVEDGLVNGKLESLYLSDARYWRGGACDDALVEQRGRSYAKTSTVLDDVDGVELTGASLEAEAGFGGCVHAHVWGRRASLAARPAHAVLYTYPPWGWPR